MTVRYNQVVSNDVVKVSPGLLENVDEEFMVRIYGEVLIFKGVFEMLDGTVDSQEFVVIWIVFLLRLGECL